MADTDQVLNLAAIIREVDGGNNKGAAALAESILDHPSFRAALAEEPAVSEGREPAAVTGQPSDEELLETLDKATATFPPRHPEAEGLNAVEYPLALELRKARAVLARWGNRQGSLDSSAPQPPAEGEVAELVVELRMMASQAAEACQFTDAENLYRAADLLQRGQSALHRLHRLQQENARFREPERTILCDILANGTLLPDPDGKRYDVQPVPVSERLPGPEDCDANGRCWWGTPSFVNSYAVTQSAQWRLSAPDDRFGSELFWLPAHAMPLPGQEVEG